MASHKRASESLRQVALISNPSSFICRSCRLQQLRSRQCNTQQLRHASKGEIPFTEKLRRKIWGTDNPPGLEDPYGGPSFLERARQRNQEKQVSEYRQTDDEATRIESDLLEDTITAAPEPEEYVAAETWDGLQHVGHKGDWRDLPPRPEDEYHPWLDTARPPASSRADLLSCLHQAIVESLSARTTTQSTGTNDEPSIEPAEIEAISSPKIMLSQNRSIPELEAARNLENTSAVDESVSDEGFLSAKLDFTDPVTFSILKRFSQLSGHRIPDPVLNAMQNPDPSKNLSYLIMQLLKPGRAKQKPVNETLMRKSALTSQSNVMILKRRETPVDKEKELGRWKVIERELKSRGLPVLGKAVA